ncbi:MAG: DNA translocase FtsK 4TM domain-containing protein [Rhodobacteraceae bacterium]|nr:DNA translocase FtsK 4TM domain-containing protein [Paracoccaceae bacterium]
MASYQARRRDPLLDQGVQAALERRGKELLGAALAAAGIMTALMLATYSPDDPSWLAVTDAPAQNALGRFGAALASPLYVIAGHGAWGIVLVLLAWGLRLMFHRGEERMLNRVIFAPIAIALMSVYASTLVAGPDWHHSFGLGGLFGDTILGALLGILPFGAGLGLKILSLVLAVAAIAMLSHVTGFVPAERRAIAQFLWTGTVATYAWLVDAALRFAEARRERRAELAASAPPASAPPAPARAARTPVLRAAAAADPALAPGPASAGAAPLRADPRPAAAAARPRGLGASLAGAFRRLVEPAMAAPLPELVEGAAPRAGWAAEAPPEDRIRARIADAVRSRGIAPAEPPLTRAEPPLTAARVPGPFGTRPADPVPAPVAEALSDFERNAFADLDDDDDDDEDQGADCGLAPPLPRAGAAPRRVVQHSARRAAAPSRQALAEAQPALRFADDGPSYEIPPLSLLAAPPAVQRHQLSDEALEENARMLESVLDDYGVKGEIVSVRPGPVVTMYELEPAPGLKASRVIGLADDIARSMSALSARVSTVPGRSVIGIELPNAHREKVVLREILSHRDFGDSNQRLPLALGKDIAGQPVVANLAKMPHLLIAGTTGSGKSVAINTMILSLLYKLTPEECRLIMIDPKMLELSVYDGIPHLLSPVVTDPKKAVVALKWVVGEMEERYRKMSKMGVRNIEGYNGRVREALEKGEMFRRTVQTGFDEETGDPVFETEEIAPVAIPYIVVIVDEMADLMMVAGKEIEACIQRLAQMARASGIHLIMATQRPSVDVITGTIKANFPTRISFQVTSKIDSRTILGEQGAEQLLGMGDMLYMAGGSRITRVHGPFVSDEEVEEVVRHLKSFGPPEYMSGVVEGPEEEAEGDIDLVLGLGGNTDSDDALYDQAVQVVLRDRKVSTSYIQRKLGVGYNKAARLVEQMEEQGLVSAANHVGKREILVPEG